MTTPRYTGTCHRGPGAVSPPSLDVYRVGALRRGHPGSVVSEWQHVGTVCRTAGFRGDELRGRRCRQDLGQSASRFLPRAQRAGPEKLEAADDPAAARLPAGDLGL